VDEGVVAADSEQDPRSWKITGCVEIAARNEVISADSATQLKTDDVSGVPINDMSLATYRIRSRRDS
jgi:hypothetical protein